MNELFAFRAGEIPLLVSFPHSGTEIPAEMAAGMTAAGLQRPDTDWHLPRLYEFEWLHRASTIRANFSRYVIDPNRPPDNSNLYPGRPTPQLCPVHTFSGQEIYQLDQRPEPADVRHRLQRFWQPYHQQIAQELGRLKAQFGAAVLFDAHSIASRVPRLFDGVLPDLNIGTAHGQSCAEPLESAIREYLATQHFTYAVNGRFVGGYITRHYGQPNQQVHAVQLELSQATYMDEPSGQWHDGRAAAVRPVLEGIIDTLVQWITASSG